MCHAQHQERKVLVYNIGFGGLTAGIGSIINTPKGQNWKKNFVRSFWQGCIGGTLHYTGKKTVFLINKNENLAAAWPAKLQHAAGSSIIENAATNQPFLQNWNIDVWPVRVDYSFKDNGVKVRFLPSTIYSVIAAAVNHARFDTKSTLLTGVLVFKVSNGIQGYYPGTSYARGMIYSDDSDKYSTIAHEYIHGFQYSEYIVFSTWLHPWSNNIKPDGLKRFYENYVYADFPYHYLFYSVEGLHPFRYFYRNFFEFEAERFSTNSYVPVH
jgi:hypothetical protein